jgi:thiamine pyrophosphate-dependent acetolactate synthase large subunit-like protein
MVEAKKEVPLGMREYYPYGALRIADVLKEQGVEVVFGVHGGHIWNMVDAISNAGIKVVTVRHEQSAVYAAEAYSKVTGKVGVAFATVGPGVSNTVSSVQQAFISCSPVVALYGAVPPVVERTYTIQPSYIMDLMRHITKWSQRLVEPGQVKHVMTDAFKDAQSYPKGPIALEFTGTTLPREPSPPPRDMFYVPHWRKEETVAPVTPPAGDPRAVEQCVQAIYQAEHPVLYAGDGVHWSEASEELVEFAELAQVPVCARRIARGAISEIHPQSFGSQVGRPVLAECDLFVGLGLKVGFADQYGATWPQRIIQVNESPDHIWTFIPTELAIIGSPKVILRQMIDCAKANGLTPPSTRAQWLQKVQETHLAGYQARVTRAMKYRDHAPVHFGYLAKVIWDVAEELYQGRNRVMVDGYTISDYMPAYIRARYSGQVMDASEQAGVGHGVGMAIGAAFGDPQAVSAPVLALMGDAGMGLAGMDYETALRYHLPIVYIVTENNGWLGSMRYSHYGLKWEALGEQDREYGEESLPGSRYDKLTEVFGGHGEYVERPEEIRPALERACRAAEQGKTAIVNVKMDPSVANRQSYTAGYQQSWGHIPWNQLAPRGKALRRNLMPGFPWDEAGVPPMPMPDPWEPYREGEKWE